MHVQSTCRSGSGWQGMRECVWQTSQCQQLQQAHIKRLSQKPKPSLCAVFVNSQEPEILCYPHVTLPFSLVEWTGMASLFGFQPLGKLVFPPHCTLQRQMTESLLDNDVQTGINPAASEAPVGFPMTSQLLLWPTALLYYFPTAFLTNPSVSLGMLLTLAGLQRESAAEEVTAR